MKKSLTSFVAGFILAALLFGSSNLQAQEGLSKDVSDYLAKSAAWTERMQADYRVATDYLFGKSTLDKAKVVSNDLTKLIDEMPKANTPLAARAIHEQLRFAGERCQNHISYSTRITDTAKLNTFDFLLIVPIREACIVQINAAKLMIIEAGISAGIDPYEK